MTAITTVADVRDAYERYILAMTHHVGYDVSGWSLKKPKASPFWRIVDTHPETGATTVVSVLGRTKEAAYYALYNMGSTVYRVAH